MKERIRFSINGEWTELQVDPEMTLADMLREQLYLTGTKVGCGKGECGACTIIMDGKAILSCKTPVMKADGCEIITIEGLAKDGKLSPIQQQFIEKGAIQCGFCTPGFVLSATALLAENDNPSRNEIREALSGNICRCGGYHKIEEAVLAAASQMRRDD